MGKDEKEARKAEEEIPAETESKKRRAGLYRFNSLLLAGFLLFGGLYFGKNFLMPLALGALFAMLLVPVCARLESWKIKRPVAALISVLLVVIILGGLIVLLYLQISALAKELPELEAEAYDKLRSIQDYIADATNFTHERQTVYVQRQLNNFFRSLGTYITSLLLFTGTFLFYFIIVIVYAYLFLLLRSRLKKFVFELTEQGKEPKTRDIIEDVTTVAGSYIAGVFLVVAILSVINTVGLYFIGIEHALFFGLLAGMLNIIPYLGSITGSVIPMIMAFLTKDSLWYVLGVGVFFLIVQEFESYYLTPSITGSKVKLNPLATIMALLLGAAVWGIIGMILFIPMLGVIKVIFDNLEHLKYYGYVIGKEEEPGETD